MSCLVLDAMGVIFRAADDVAELLIPYIGERGGSTGSAAIETAYHEASLGRISADEFWLRVGLEARVEADYLARHQLNDGVIDLLRQAKSRRVPVWCLSNDVGRWSRHLRETLGVAPWLAGATISADVGRRKPDPRIFRSLLDASGFDASEILFVDDRGKNVDAARGCGIDSVLFEPGHGFGRIAEWLSQQAPGR